jgi:hypothetical protein
MCFLTCTHQNGRRLRTLLAASGLNATLVTVQGSESLLIRFHPIDPFRMHIHKTRKNDSIKNICVPFSLSPWICLCCVLCKLNTCISFQSADYREKKHLEKDFVIINIFLYERLKYTLRIRGRKLENSRVPYQYSFHLAFLPSA